MLNDFLYILGPCGIDDEETYLHTGKILYGLMQGKNFYFKASFDKANRTSIKGERGKGLDVGIELFGQLKKQCPGIKLTTDVHECWQVEKLVDVIDMVQIPSMLSRQSDLIVECAKHFNTINIKQMQFLGENNVTKSVDKVRETNNNATVYLTHRGTAYGDHKLLVDFTIVDNIKKHYDGYIFDTTHSTQRSREVYQKSGDSKLAERYFLSCPIFGYTGVFAEVHPDPQSSCSDKDCQIYLSRISYLLKRQEEIKNIMMGVEYFESGKAMTKEELKSLSEFAFDNENVEIQ